MQEVTNSISMEFVPIPAGTFQMGCSPEEAGRRDDEMPRREVTISQPFYLGKHPVTHAQWEQVMGARPGGTEGSRHPVANVGWDEVQEFIEKLHARERHKGYRLPTEAEWEYAARAGSTTAYGFGDDAGRLGNCAWYKDNNDGWPMPVGEKQPNAWGLYDMHGNVWEWVQDWYGPYGAEAVTDPRGPGAGEYRVLRGGSARFPAEYCRSASRLALLPDARVRDAFLTGFRLVLSSEVVNAYHNE